MRRHNRGLSEIVGTLMLVLIVVSAATLLAAFIASYQKQLQTEETFSHNQSLESIKVLGLVTSLNGTGTGYRNVNFTLASEYINPSVILSISIDNFPLKQFWWQSFVNHSWFHCNLTQTLTLPSQEEIYVSTNTSAFNNSFLAASPLPNQYLKIDVYTSLQNDFTRVFLPPVAWAVVSEINPSGSNPITVLDGSQSSQPGGNASIVTWAWSVSGGGLTSTSTSVASASFSPASNGSLMNGTANVSNATATFIVPAGFIYGAGDVVSFTPGDNLKVTGGCTLSGSSIGPKPAVNLTGTTLTVKFNFTTTLSGCTGGAGLWIVPGGVQLAPLALTASGEEYEISPALQVPLAMQAPYSVTLVVTNSNGLVGTILVKYTPPA